jgi:hypothetical protein
MVGGSGVHAGALTEAVEGAQASPSTADSVGAALCSVGEIEGEGLEALEAFMAPEAPPMHDPRYRAPEQLPHMEPGWHGGGPPTMPRRKVPDHVIAQLEEYKERARHLSAEEAAELKAELLGEER